MPAPEPIRRIACDALLRSQVVRALQAFTPEAPMAATPRRPAAVALAITEAGYGADLDGFAHHAEWSCDAAMLLTRRAGKLRNHSGQWALPGGRVDAGETAEQTALRELSEEVGLQLDESAVLGRLDDFATRSGFVMTPVVVWAGPARSITANPDEVASIHRIPLSEFMRADAPLLETVPDSSQPVLRMPVGNRWIAAPTGAILYQFREVCVAGRYIRVSHFEQPDFAWK